ncbi:mechanosensitive ion channel family protein [Marseilla massiliensis]|mgnify:FL=1|jgi:miniconductance mechanosensitive channel|nr:mechanosensitive ion channel domain-containing protein [Marseilla massiliensis]CCY66417.1 mscS Mechanosensitive ion channel [Prevotella sp. CAG:1124]
MDGFDVFILDFLRHTAGVSESMLTWLYPLTAAFAVALFSYVCTAVFRFIVMPAVQKLTERTKAKWDDYIFNHRVMKAFRRIIPPVIWYVALPLVLTHSPGLLSFLLKVCNIYLVVVSLLFVSAFLHSLYEISEEHKKLRNRPLKGVFQMFDLLAFVVGLILIISIIIDKSAISVLAGLGASAAILMLIFKDTILGLVAGVQLTANDMLRPGDWITMQKYGANGYVREVSLTTVKVQNFDKTITTIPPYLLVSDSFQNWRGMWAAGGRRMKLSVNIDANTVRFCSADDIARFVEKGYVSASQYADAGFPVSNTQVYRDFMIGYMRSHPDVNKDLMIMVRMLQPTPEGLPVELYCFCSFTEWAPFEMFQSSMLDYAVVMAREFGLSIFQRPAGTDLKG